MKCKELWDLESAMKVLEHDTVDSKIWAEAVEWLMLYGPPEIKDLLLEASTSATSSSFPGLSPSHYTPSGQAVYDVSALAKTLGIPEEEVKKILEDKEQTHATFSVTPSDNNETMH